MWHIAASDMDQGSDAAWGMYDHACNAGWKYDSDARAAIWRRLYAGVEGSLPDNDFVRADNPSGIGNCNVKRKRSDNYGNITGIHGSKYNSKYV